MPSLSVVFVCLVFVIFKDVHNELDSERGKFDGISITETMYADDTVLITNNVNVINQVQSRIEGICLWSETIYLSRAGRAPVNKS